MGGIARPVAVALGSNLGDRRAHLDHAIARLHTCLDALRVSAFLETEPVGVTNQPPFLNGAAVGFSARPAGDILDDLQAIERERGRERPYASAPRTLDLDLILCGDEVIREPALEVPHPRFRQRRFVLDPLAEIAPDLVDPITGETIAALRDRLLRG